MQAREYVTTKYVMKLPMILMVVLIGFFDIQAIGIKNFSPLFYACYIYFFLGVVIGVELTGKRGLVIPGLILMTAVQLLIARDMVLTVNILSALGVIILCLLLLTKKTERWGFPAFVVTNIVYFSQAGTENVLLVSCLVVGAFYSVGRVFKKDVDYRYIVSLLLLLVIFLPVNDKPIKWKFVRNMFERLTDGLGKGMDGSFGDWFDFGNSYSGYSGVGTLSGAVEGESKKELQFKKNGDSKSLYLKGAQFSTITQDGFTDKTNISSDYNSWFVTFINAMMNADITRSEALCFTKIESADVTYDHLRTEDIIYPANLLSIDASLENGLEEKKGRGFEYKIQYMVIDYASPYFTRILEGDSMIHSYEEAEDYTFNTLKIKMTNFMTKEKYDSIAETIKNGSYKDSLAPYLDTSMSNDRIMGLSQELTKECKDDYEKAKVIEHYLRTYNYDASVDLRDRDNYIDSFLFEEKSGYCVHFASAMVLLLRDAGVPARYVSGYHYDVKEKSDKVMSSDAHAWVEAYIDGVGWVNFEPTASSALAESWGLVAADSSKETHEAIEETVEEEIEEPDYEKLKERYSQTPGGSSEVEKRSNKVKAEIVKRILMYVLYFVIAAVILLLLTIGMRSLWFHLLPPEKKLREMVKRECRGIEKSMESQDDKDNLQKNSSSLYDYLKYVSEEEREKTRRMFELYYRVRFRGDSVNDKEIRKLSKGA